MFRKRVKYICGSLAFLLVLAGCIGYALHLKQTNAVAEQKVTRGVIDSLNQLPDTKKVENPKYKVGTKENPFLVLEIVPYEEYAEFGYMIKGCEPVKVEDMFGSKEITTVGRVGSTEVKQASQCFFFPDEKEGKAKYYDGGEESLKHFWADKILEGYYEKTDVGQGCFEQKEDGSIVKKDGGDIIWHTVNEYEKDDYKEIDFNDTKTILKEKGDRRYTKRESKTADQDGGVKTTWTYYTYKNKDNFLRDSLLLSEKEAENYSIVIKTVTPKELNDNPEWVSYSNLISISSRKHIGALLDVWKKHNRLGKTSNLQTADYKENFMGERDISWEVAKKIYFRATQSNDSNNYAGVVMDRNVYCLDIEENFPSDDGYKRNVEFDVYDFNFKSTGKYNATGSNNNVFKLSVMLLCMDSDVFKSLYFNKDNPFKRGQTLIDDNGKIILQLQNGDAADYWTFYTFFVINADEKKMSDGYWQVWNRKENDSDNETIAWKRWKYNVNLTGSDPWIYNHVYTYKGDNSLNMVYMKDMDKNSSNEDKRFTDFYDSVEDYKDKRFGTDEEIKKGKESDDQKVREEALAAEKAKKEYKYTPSNAVRYILGVFDGGDTPKPEKKVINILDLEPSVNLVKAESKTNNENVKVKPEYYLTENYVRMLLSDFDSDIKITHMTTAEFIGKTEDINSKYDMIFMGLDDSAYNKDSNGKTVWNDSSMDGKIYFHTGDKMTSTEQIMKPSNGLRNRSVDFLWSDKSSGNPWEKHITLRFPGNDITELKKAELEDFARSGHPIVAVSNLYNNNETLVDKYSNVYKFIKENKSKGVYNTSDYEGIMDALKANDVSIEFTKTPVEYKGETDDSNEIKDGSYLPKNSADQSILEFAFKLKDSSNGKYKYKIYIDQNQDGKYSDDEIYYTSDELSADEAQSYTCRLSRLFLGVVQWKIEVYNASNSSIRFVKTGCSAAKRSDGIDKKQINVLQIMPSDNSYQGKLDLETNKLFTQYYKKIQAYEINVDSITVDEFESWFKNNNEKKEFSFDISAGLSDANPKNYTTTLKNKLKNYNMLIFGFGDTYGVRNISNDHGAVDYIKYFITLGKSVLFTHDLSSMYNVNKNDFGYVVNAQLRDVMGMNRYKAVSNQLSDKQREQLRSYQSKQKYDKVTDINGNDLYEKHGFTYFAMKRLGDKSGTDQKMPYKYMITGVDGKPINSSKNNADKTGFNNGNDITVKAGKMNDGQVTSYPFEISDTLDISETHGQWYQLNMEDPEVTVWYSLIDDDKKKDGSSTNYAVSPYDAANNYYIYSKANVFYSGVGHSTVKSDMEARLFINTMIAAYRAAYQPPVVDILNEEAELTDIDNTTYQITNAQEYDVDPSGGNKVKKEEGGETKVRFSPVELNAVKTKLDCTIYYPSASAGEDGSEKGCKYIDIIYDAKTGKEIKAEKNADGEYVFKDLQNGHEYYFKYDWEKNGSSEEIDYSQIKFKIKNDKSKEPGYTTLNMLQGQLFALD